MSEFSEINLQAAREQYRSSVKDLAQSKTQAEVILHLNRYLDASENRAKLLQDLVRPAMLAIKDFQLDALQLESQISIINTAITSLGMGILTDQFEAFRQAEPLADSSPMESLKRSMADIDRIRAEGQRNIARMEALNWEKVMVRSYAVAQAVVDMRAAALQSFAVNSLRLTIDDIGEAALETAKDKLSDAVEKAADAMITLASDPENLKVFGQTAAEIIGQSMGPIWLAGKLAYQLVRQANEIKAVYEGRGRIDELFDFIEMVRQTEELSRTQLALLRAQAEIYENLRLTGAKSH